MNPMFLAAGLLALTGGAAAVAGDWHVPATEAAPAQTIRHESPDNGEGRRGPLGERFGGSGAPAGRFEDQPGTRELRRELRQRTMQELGITRDELRQARLAALEAMVEEGLLTEEQAQRLRERPRHRQGPGRARSLG